MTIIDGEACFAKWAPDAGLWSLWAKPTMFAGSMFADHHATLPLINLEKASLPNDFTPAVLVIDLPGPEAVAMGIALAARGFQPVPLFNGTTGPQPVIDNDTLATALGAGAAMLSALTLAPDARPVFLLDSRRMDPHGATLPGHYDNRWVTLPQDFPSGTFLQSQNIKEATLINDGSMPMQDVLHVLRRWQESGIRIRLIDARSWRVEDPYDVPVPSLFRRISYAASAMLGLRRNNIGGFGNLVPEQTQSTGSGFYG
jgi:hypothetical protein